MHIPFFYSSIPNNNIRLEKKDRYNMLREMDNRGQSYREYDDPVKGSIEGKDDTVD
jgi:hypothetical protein